MLFLFVLLVLLMFTERPARVELSRYTWDVERIRCDDYRANYLATVGELRAYRGGI